MADTTKKGDQEEFIEPDDVAELRERVRMLEEELRNERRSRRKAQKGERDRAELTNALEKLTDEFNRVTRGMLFAGMEALAVSADMTRAFVDRTNARSTRERRDTMTNMMTDLPVDMANGMVDALEEGIDSSERVVDKFYAKYKEREPDDDRTRKA
jgi:hypothetical protein